MSFNRPPIKNVIEKTMTIIVIMCALMLYKKAEGREFELGAGYHQVKMDWLKGAKFKHNLTVIEGTYWNKYNLGLRAQYNINESIVNDRGARYFGDIEHKLYSLYSLQTLYRYKGIEIGATYNAYKECYSNAKGYSDYCNSDDDYGYTVGYAYKLPKDFSVRINYNYIYQKDKLDDEEVTTSWSLTVVKPF